MTQVFIVLAVAAIAFFGSAGTSLAANSLLEECERSNSLKFHDCQCVADSEQEAREWLSDKYEVLPMDHRKIKRLQRDIERATKSIAKAKTESVRKDYEREIERKEGEIVLMTTRRDPNSHEVGQLLAFVRNNPVCRDAEKARSGVMPTCERSMRDAAPEERSRVCGCVGELVATKWMDPETRSSSTPSKMVKRALKDCK
ncbi:MAG: hypothetical protein AAGD13_08895 [Pseudomonadota bacterium]